MLSPTQLLPLLLVLLLQAPPLLLVLTALSQWLLLLLLPLLRTAPRLLTDRTTLVMLRRLWNKTA